MTFQAPKKIEGLEQEPNRALIKSLTAIANELAVLGVPDELITDLKTADYLAQLGQLVLVTPPATGMRVLIPLASPQNATRKVRIAVLSVASGGSVVVAAVGGEQTINGAATMTLSSVGITELESLGAKGWGAISGGGGGGGEDLAATLALGNSTGGVDVDFTGNSELQMAADPGAAGEVLTSSGPGLSPVWSPAAGGGTDPRIFAWWGV